MIRFATEADIPAILDIYGPYILNTAISFEYSVPTLEEFTERFLGITAQFPWLVWEENGQLLGYAYASLPFGRAAYRWCAASSIYLAPHAQGKGIGTKALTAAMEYYRSLGERHFLLETWSGNQRMLGCARKLGFAEVKREKGAHIVDGKEYDALVLEKWFRD